MFIDNKYTKTYHQIIAHAQQRDPSNLGYLEKHHIIPKSLGGSNARDNLVLLTAREHFICHRLLIRCVASPEARRSMGWALHRMLYSISPNHEARFLPKSKRFAVARAESVAARMSVPVKRTPEHQAKIAAANTKRLKGTKFSSETRQKMSASHSGERNAMHGKSHSEESKAKMREKQTGKKMPPKSRMCCLGCRKETTKAGLTAFHSAC